MATFKVKPDKIKYLTEIKTLDERHSEIVAGFKKKQQMLPRQKEKLIRMQTHLANLEKKNPSTYTNKDIKMKSKLKTDISILTEDIYTIENGTDEIEYYAKTYDLLIDYYDIVDNNDDILYEQNPELIKKKDDSPITKEMDQLDYLNMLSRKRKTHKKVSRKRKRNDEIQPKTNILDFLVNNNTANTTNTTNTTNITNTTNTTNATNATNVTNANSIDATNKSYLGNNNENIKDRSELHRQFQMLIDNEYKNNKKINILKECLECGIDKMLIQGEGIFVCQDCGEVEMIIIECEKCNYNDNIPDKPGYPYKRINHYSEWLSQFQAKESTEIHKEIYDKIIAELHKNKIYNMKTLTRNKIKDVLKKLGLTNYYEHTPHIISKLSGVPPPTINRDTEEQLRKMFKQIQEPFERNCPKGRINFLSYSYVLHKFCELLELDDFLKCFPLLKSREKLREQDKIWKKICKDLKWEFIPSI
jgi:predicted RNA-binding Zn-ribbon protein involved in translation (DUF1610 family)